MRRIHVEPGEVRIVDAREPYDLIAFLSDKHRAGIDVLAFGIFRKGNEGARIERPTQLVWA
jgi:hypothetical protein